MTDVTTVLIVDDHEVVCRGWRAYLDALPGFTVVGEAESGEAAILLAAEHIPDVALIDLVMSGMDGVEATRRVKNASPRTQSVVLTSYHQDEHIFPALKAGAISYILKDITMDELADAVRRAARGGAGHSGVPRCKARGTQPFHRTDQPRDGGTAADRERSEQP